MKRSTYSLPLSALVFLAFLSSAFTVTEIIYTVRIQGVEGRDILKDGVTSYELTEITVEVNQENFKISEFQLVLARGKSPVGFPAQTVSGNKGSLQKYRQFARPGDRLVIDVKQAIASNGEKVDIRDVILQIPIK